MKLDPQYAVSRRYVFGLIAGCLVAWSASMAPPAQAADDPFADCWSRSRLSRTPCVLRRARALNMRTEAAERLAALHKSEPDDFYLAYGLGDIALETGDAARAAAYYSMAAEGFSGQDNPEREGFARLNLNESLRQLGRFDEASIEVSRAFELAVASGSSELIASCRLGRLRLARQLGDDLESQRRSLAELGDYLAAEREEGLSYGVLKMWHYEFGEVLRSLHRLDEALGIHGSWADLAREVDKPYDEASAVIHMATTASQMDWRPDARAETLRLAERALELAAVSGNTYAENEALRLLGLLQSGEDGQKLLRRCLDSASPGSTAHIRCQFALAASLATTAPLLAEGAEASVEAVLNGALAAVAGSSDPWAAIKPWNEMFQAIWSTASREQALERSLAVIDLIESVRGLQLSDRGRVDFFAAWVGAYHALVGRVLSAPAGPSPQELDAAFRVGERMRARALLDDLAAADRERGTLVGHSEPPPVEAVQGRERDRDVGRAKILGVIVDRQRELQSPSLGDERRRLALQFLERAEADLADLEASEPSSVGWIQEPASLSDVDVALADDEAFFSFQLAPDENVSGLPAGGSWLLVVTRAERQLYRLPSGPEIEAKIAMLLGLVEAQSEAGHVPADGLIESAAAALSRDLLADAVAALPLGVDRWIIAPDGALHLLPFGLLAPHVQLSTVPSATFWLRWRAAPLAPRAALAFADPAGFADAAENPRGAAASRWAELHEGLRLGRLPHARREGRAIVERLGSPSRLLLGVDASEHALETLELDEYGVLHFAAHAVLDAERPYRSALLLAPGGDHHDGLLQPREIADLDLQGKLVVLSACQSAHGEAQLGEGAESLARAFFRAGARTVVASRWRLRDDDAAAFFDIFYESLVRGVSVDAAVAEARGERRRDGAAVGAWAGVVVMGDGGWSPVGGLGSTPGRRPAIWGCAGLVGFGMLALVGAYRRSSRLV